MQTISSKNIKFFHCPCLAISFSDGQINLIFSGEAANIFTSFYKIKTKQQKLEASLDCEECQEVYKAWTKTKKNHKFSWRRKFINYFFHFVYLEINLVPLHVYAFKSSFYFIHIFTYFLPACVLLLMMNKKFS